MDDDDLPYGGLRFRQPNRWDRFVETVFRPRVGIGVAVVYIVFYSGGVWSFDYTHNCVRSHEEDGIDAQGNDYTATVCDFYSTNGKRWTFLDPVRAIIGLP